MLVPDPAPFLAKDLARTVCAAVLVTGCSLGGAIQGAQAAIVEVVPAGEFSLVTSRFSSAVTGQWIHDDEQRIRLCFSHGPQWAKPDCVSPARPVPDKVSIVEVMPGAMVRTDADDAGFRITLRAHVWVRDSNNIFYVCSSRGDNNNAGNWKFSPIDCTAGANP